MRIGAILLLSLVILGSAARLRAPEYDEAYSIFLTAGDPRPAWPAGVFHPGEVRGFYQGRASLPQIARDLRTGDVHPPLYFWCLEYWRRLAGPGWFAARMLSVVFSVAALAGIAWLAALAGIPAASAMLIALLSYGFAYTGIVARGFALAQALNMFGMALILSANRSRTHARKLGLAGGLAFGAACFSNYLAVFVGLAAFAWLALQRCWRILAPAVLGFAVFLPFLLYFFIPQRHARIGQFQAFSLPHALALLAKDSGAAIFGGLPLYAGRAGGIVTAALILLIALCAGLSIRCWQRRLNPFGLAAIAVPAGLLGLGIAFDNTPIEIRYLAFATPFIALILAGTLTPFWRRLLLAVQACGIAGLAFAPATMQPQAIAARQSASFARPSALLLLPFGNDGVGIPGPFIAAAPGNLRILLLKPGTPPDLATAQTVILAAIGIDDASRRARAETAAQLRANPCWAPQAAPRLLLVFSRNCPFLLSSH